MAKYFTPTQLSENIRETPEGFLVCIGVPIGRTGKMIYGEGETPLKVGPDGKVAVSREASELFSKDAMASFEGKPFTIRHPDEFVNPENWNELAKGVLQNVRRSPEKDENGEEVLLADILVTNALAIAMIKNGLREVSCGYEAVYEQTGEGLGRQTNIIGNHVALVEQGRAGPSYAINDHKKERFNMGKWAESLKAAFSKAIDAAEEGKEKEGKDEEMKGAKDEASYDELVKLVKDLASKIDGMKPKDEKPMEEKKSEEKPKDEAEEKKPEEKSKDEPASSSVEERLKAIEMALAKLMEMESNEQSGDEEKKSEDEESEDDAEEMGDEESAKEKEKKTGDSASDVASRAEILSPGIKVSKDVKQKAVLAAYETEDGKAVIDLLTGGKKPDFKTLDNSESLFMAASEILKSRRGTGLGQTKNPKSFESGDNKAEPMTADKLNQLNQAFWSRK